MTKQNSTKPDLYSGLVGRQVHFRARKITGLARVIVDLEENSILAYDNLLFGGSLWQLCRPQKKAPWKGFETRPGRFYCTKEYIAKLGSLYKGCEAGKLYKLVIWRALIDFGLVPNDLVNLPINEPLLTLGKRLNDFGIGYWSGCLPYDSREHIACLLSQKGISEAKKYLRDDANRMIVLRKEAYIYRRACAILEAEFDSIHEDNEKSKI